MNPSGPQPSAAASRDQAGDRTDRVRSEESWVEIGSQPSSSSLSSVGESIVTAGLQVEQQRRHRRHLRTTTSAQVPIDRPSRRLELLAQAQHVSDMSSQEEFEESESESDRVLTSSNEGLVPGAASDDAAQSDDDENRTAVNYPIRRSTRDAFTPQPNAFSHPPTSRSVRHANEPCPGSYFPHITGRSGSRPEFRQSLPSQEATVQHSPFNAISPSHNAAAHHHEALRASLSTLLSCAAAARGLTKSQPAATADAGTTSARIVPNTLRLVPESRLPGTSRPQPASLEPNFPPTLRRPVPTSTATSSDGTRPRSTSPAPQQHKRKSSTTTRGTSKDRQQRERGSKKQRRASSASSASTIYSSGGSTEELLVSPTLLTWVVGAGVVVILSAISFTAGYAVGHEVGRVEASFAGNADMVGDVGSCAAEVSRGSGLGLRRLRFGVQA